MGKDIGIPVGVLDHGFVRLVDWMGNDSSIVRAARVSLGEGTKTPEQDEKLIHYLMEHKHSSPFEHVTFTFHAQAQEVEEIMEVHSGVHLGVDADW